MRSNRIGGTIFKIFFRAVSVPPGQGRLEKHRNLCYIRLSVEKSSQVLHN